MGDTPKPFFPTNFPIPYELHQGGIADETIDEVSASVSHSELTGEAAELFKKYLLAYVAEQSDKDLELTPDVLNFVLYLLKQALPEPVCGPACRQLDMLDLPKGMRYDASREVLQSIRDSGAPEYMNETAGWIFKEYLRFYYQQSTGVPVNSALSTVIDECTLRYEGDYSGSSVALSMRLDQAAWLQIFAQFQAAYSCDLNLKPAPALLHDFDLPKDIFQQAASYRNQIMESRSVLDLEQGPFHTFKRYLLAYCRESTHPILDKNLESFPVPGTDAGILYAAVGMNKTDGETVYEQFRRAFSKRVAQVAVDKVRSELSTLESNLDWEKAHQVREYCRTVLGDDSQRIATLRNCLATSRVFRLVRTYNDAPFDGELDKNAVRGGLKTSQEKDALYAAIKDNGVRRVVRRLAEKKYTEKQRKDLAETLAYYADASPTEARPRQLDSAQLESLVDFCASRVTGERGMSKLIQVMNSPEIFRVAGELICSGEEGDLHEWTKERAVQNGLKSPDDLRILRIAMSNNEVRHVLSGLAPMRPEESELKILATRLTMRKGRASA
ncbi:hypothetical protein AB0N09_42965 [Streptomyces erythrochromogenes]|uniref:hypothetical protein n=1 Tax=Streptomyces erythrochromogenes TaxID=285574 RepID=UPI003440FBA8